MRWIVELVRINISFEVSTISKYLAFPCTGHIYQDLDIFNYLEVHITNEISFDPIFHEVKENQKTRTKIEEIKKFQKDVTE